MDTKGVITVEFILTSMAFLILTSGILTLVSERMDTVSSTKELGNARMISKNLAESINKVYNGGNGHKIVLDLPSISDSDYWIKVNFSGTFVLIDGMIGKTSINPKKISNSDDLKESTVSMHADHNYVIKNVEDSNGNNWIVINEIK